MNDRNVLTVNDIKTRIYTIRGVQIMFDNDLADLYQVKTKELNKAVQRNIERFPQRYRFQISRDEWDVLRFQSGTSKRGGRRYLPYAYTEQGVAMLSSVLRSDTAVKVSIQIIDTFIAMRRFLLSSAQVFQRLNKV